MAIKSVLVTGWAGFIGWHLVGCAFGAAAPVRALDSLAGQVHGGGVPEHLNRAAEFIPADVGDAEAVKAALPGGQRPKGCRPYRALLEAVDLASQGDAMRLSPPSYRRTCSKLILQIVQLMRHLIDVVKR